MDLIHNNEFGAALDLVREDLEAARAEQGVPGIAAAVVHDQETVWSMGTGLSDLESQRPAAPDMVCRVASITKVFTATMLMQLREENKVRLDDPLEWHLPEYKPASPDRDPQPVTLRRVVSHSAGIPRDLDMDYFGEDEFPKEEDCIRLAAEAGVRIVPCTKNKYSNVGLALLGIALSRAAGVPYEEYVEERILKPLGMENSGFRRDDYSPGRIATGYTCRRDAGPDPIVWTDLNGAVACGGLMSTVLDLAKFLSLQFRDDPSGEGAVLGGASLREMHTPVFMDPDWRSGVAIGWHTRRICDEVLIGHGGGLPGYSTHIAAIPALKLGVAVFVNAQIADSEWGAASAASSMLETLIPVLKRVGRRSEPKPAFDPHEEWRRYTGEYRNRYWSDLEVRLVGGKLLLATVGAKSGDDAPLEHVEGHTFRTTVGSPGEPVVFEMGEDGRPVKLVMPGSVSWRVR